MVSGEQHGLMFNVRNGNNHREQEAKGEDAELHLMVGAGVYWFCSMVLFDRRGWEL